MSLAGAFAAKKKNGTVYYRSSITVLKKHISLGSFLLETDAHKAYNEAKQLLHTSHKQAIPTYEEYKSAHCILSYDKWIMLRNLQDNHIYFPNPIYLMKHYFFYYLSPTQTLLFDTDDLFYYSTHKIMQRKGHLFVNDYGMQVSLLSRYGIKSFAVLGRDYEFVNQNPFDFRYHNIKVINRFYGVTRQSGKKPYYLCRIHLNGNYIIGRYATEIEAAIAYNKAIATLNQKGIAKNFTENYIDTISDIEYAKIYNSIKISKKVREFGI